MPIRATVRDRLARLAIAGLLAVCPTMPLHAGDAPAGPVPPVCLPATIDGSTAIRAGFAANTPWWSAYGDPALADLMQRVHAGNTGIAQSRARLAMARAAARAGNASQTPSLGIAAGASQASGPLVNAAGESGSLFTAGAAASWEIDLSGRLAATRSAERLDAEATAALLADTMLLMEAETTRGWLAGRSLGEELAIARRIATLREEQLAIARRRQAAGTVSPRDVDAARRRVDEALGQARDLEERHDRNRRQLAFLLGQADAGGLQPSPAAIDMALPAVPAGLPSELLLRRPDLVAARKRVIAADERLRAERSGWLPLIGLTASGGTASPGLSGLLASSAGSFGLASLLAIPLLDGGRHKARVAGRDAERELATAQYREQVLGAFRDVSDRLSGYHACRADLVAALEAERDGAGLQAMAQARLANGTLSRVEAIEAAIGAAERSLQRAGRQRDCLLASVGVYQALGGGI